MSVLSSRAGRLSPSQKGFHRGRGLSGPLGADVTNPFPVCREKRERQLLNINRPSRLKDLGDLLGLI